MISDALLGSHAQPASTRGTCKASASLAVMGLRHWWPMTTDREYLVHTKRRLVWKYVSFSGCMFLFEFPMLATVPSVSWSSPLWHIMGMLLIRCIIFMAIPHDSIWMDALLAAWAVIDVATETRQLRQDYILYAGFTYSSAGLHSRS
ncbi:unnamed protein product [Prorocentrum cordatum]|uniref:Uncharacterized protein n=1 Tax=Prorocentrum cordatum TaxID=2364126 RepID=A0ABN9PL59_9DINO|nr:unnamed protein product [Polarella glacialis]